MFIRLTFVTLLLSIATGSQAYTIQSVNQYGLDASPQNSMTDVQSGLDTEPTPPVTDIQPLYSNQPNHNTDNITGETTGNTDVQNSAR